MRLGDLDPKWIGFHGGPARCGVMFRCPCKPDCAEQLHVMFDTSLDGEPAPHLDPPRHLWHREGTTFETLTLTPSVDCSGFGHWHGHITAGEVR